MTPFDIYLLVVSIVVIIALAVFFSFVIWYIYTLTLRLIYAEYYDPDIMEDYAYPKRFTFLSNIGKVASAALCVLLTIVLLFCVVLGITENSITKSIPSLKVVKSESMSTKHSENEYLVNNDLNDQIQMFDVIVSQPLPAEKDIELYDVIIYERDGNLIVHRVVYIAEPADGSSEGRLFYTRGDANKLNDSMPVEYSQIRGIYLGERIPFVGSFVMFMQSPAGIICMLLTIFCMIIMPIVDDKIDEARNQRYRRIHNGLAAYRHYNRPF